MKATALGSSHFWSSLGRLPGGRHQQAQARMAVVVSTIRAFQSGHSDCPDWKVHLLVPPVEAPVSAPILARPTAVKWFLFLPPLSRAGSSLRPH